MRDATTSIDWEQITRSVRKCITRSGPVLTANNNLKLKQGSDVGHQRRHKTWSFGVSLSIVAVTLCLAVESILLAYAMAMSKSESNTNGVDILIVGSCAKVERTKTLLGISLNIIATVLTATSNYVMQCISAPSRQDVEEAHAAGAYLNIGILSLHNLLRKRSWKSILCFSLALTTLPINLLINSAFFSASQAINYGVMVVTGEWEYNKLADSDTHLVGFNGSVGLPLDYSFAHGMLERSKRGELQRLSKDECFKRYFTQTQSMASNVVLVVKQETSTYSTTPALSNEHNPTKYLDLSTDGHRPDGFLDPFQTFKLPEDVGLFLNPFTGNQALVFNNAQNGTPKMLSQNFSGGLYLWSDLSQRKMPSVRSLFSSFDYYYWMVMKELKYDFSNPGIRRAERWTSTSWMCNTTEVLVGRRCLPVKDTSPLKGTRDPPADEGIYRNFQHSAAAIPGPALKAPDPWLVTPRDYEVDYCLSQTTTEQCSLQCSFTILLVIILCCIFKILFMFAVLKVSEQPLVTLGDAVASFLDLPDPHTRGSCLMQQSDVWQISHRWPWQRQQLRKNTTIEQAYHNAKVTFAERLGAEAAVYRQTVTHWISAPSKARWVAFWMLYGVLLTASVAVLALEAHHLRKLGITDIFAQGVGSINNNAMFTYPITTTDPKTSNRTTSVTEIGRPGTLFANVITVNTPQVLFSILNLMYNSLFTSMVTAAEWTQFAYTRKALRVSKPKPGQRSTYWLQLPWRYSLPLHVMSTLLHYLVSRSFFLVQVNVFGWDGNPQPDRNTLACGYSPPALLLLILVLFAYLIFIRIASSWKFAPDIPVCGTNSVAIAAACHYAYSRNDEKRNPEEVSSKPLLWGVTRPADKNLTGHCSFSDGDVGKPICGMTYT